MKTGIILYVAGGDRIEDDFDVEKAVANLNLKADKVELVSLKAGHFSVMDAWWLLLAKGMRRIVCLVAEVVNGSELKLTGRQLRIWG